MRLFPVLALATAFPVVALAADPHSYAQPDAVRVTHLDLDLKLDFGKRELAGNATLKLDWKDAKAQDLVLDTRDLKIANVEALDGSGKGTPLKFALAPRDKELGSKLTIAAPTHPAAVRITYATVPQASGLQWLTPEQTADKKQPFMFSQSESIHARSWVPLQDSPAVRFTYDAHIGAPRDVRVVMSAINDAKHPLDGNFSFDQPHPIPSYLLAIAAGDIAVKETGPRSAVYAEPSVVGKAAHDLVELGQAAVDGFEHLERVLMRDVERALDLAVGDVPGGAVGDRGGDHEQRNRQRQGCSHHPLQESQRIALRAVHVRSGLRPESLTELPAGKEAAYGCNLRLYCGESPAPRVAANSTQNAAGRGMPRPRWPGAAA